MEASNDSLSVMGPGLASSPAVLLTPGRTRNIAQDMEALRLSRQDNPYLQNNMKIVELFGRVVAACVPPDTHVPSDLLSCYMKGSMTGPIIEEAFVVARAGNTNVKVLRYKMLEQVMASRESLIESHHEECESDDTILMSQEFGSTALDLIDDDILTLKEVHEHMIRSPPPTNCWPHDTLSYRTSSAFDFVTDSPVCSAYTVHTQDKDLIGGRSPRRGTRNEDARNSGTPARPRSSRSASPRSHDTTICGRPLSLPGESHLRTAFSKKSSQQSERFSLLQHPRPLRRPHSSRRDDDIVQLVQDCDK